MTSGERQGYLALAAELAGIATRLKELSDAGDADMEGADAVEFKLSEELWGLEAPSEAVAKTAMQIRELAEDPATKCPTCGAPVARCGCFLKA